MRSASASARRSPPAGSPSPRTDRGPRRPSSPRPPPSGSARSGSGTSSRSPWKGPRPRGAANEPSSGTRLPLWLQGCSHRESSLGCNPQAALDLGDRAVLGIEELGRDLLPAAEFLDREQAGRLGELLGELIEHRLVDGPVSALGEQPLPFLGEEEVDERLTALRVLGVLGQRDLGLDQDRVVGDHVLDVLAGLLRPDRLVLVREQDVALAARERRQGVACRLVLNGGVLEQLPYVLERLLLGRALVELGAVRGHDVPPS